MAEEKPIVLASSTVYDIEELQRRVYALLTAFVYEVWMQQEPTTIRPKRGRKGVSV